MNDPYEKLCLKSSPCLTVCRRLSYEPFQKISPGIIPFFQLETLSIFQICLKFDLEYTDHKFWKGIINIINAIVNEPRKIALLVTTNQRPIVKHVARTDDRDQTRYRLELNPGSQYNVQGALPIHDDTQVYYGLAMLYIIIILCHCKNMNCST